MASNHTILSVQNFQGSLGKKNIENIKYVFDSLCLSKWGRNFAQLRGALHAKGLRFQP
jgi:hypothetical protein